MEAEVRALFDRYARLFARALAGEVEPEALAGLYAAEVIAASPLGVRAGRNDAAMAEAMAQGYARYRAIGARAMHIRSLRLSTHCIAWPMSAGGRGISAPTCRKP